MLSFVRGSPHYLENAVFGRKLINEYLKKTVSSDPEAKRAAEVQSLLEEQTQSLLSAYLQKERTIKRSASPQVATHLMMLSDLVKDLIASYADLDEASLLRMDWLCPLLVSCSRSKDPSIRETVQVLLDRVLKAGDSENGEDAAGAKVEATEKLVADV